MRRDCRSAFTLVEILIVVVILGILAAVCTAQFTRLTSDAAQSTTYSELQKLRRHIGIYQARHDGQLPSVQEGDGTWGPLVGRDHFLAPPINSWVGGQNSHVIIFGTGPDTAYHRNYGWIYNDQTGEIWAASFDAEDNPIAQ